MVYATLVAEAGPFSDPAEVRTHLDNVLRGAVVKPKGNKMKGRRPSAALSAAQAKKMAADLDSYDSEMTGRRRG